MSKPVDNGDRLDMCEYCDHPRREHHDDICDTCDVAGGACEDDDED